jgi:hypothetical protein
VDAAILNKRAEELGYKDFVELAGLFAKVS